MARLSLLISFLLFLLNPTPIAARATDQPARLIAKVSPRVSPEPATVVILARFTPSPDNLTLCAVADSPDGGYRSSCVPLERDQASLRVEWRSMSAGSYTVIVGLVGRVNGKSTLIAQTAPHTLVITSTGPR